MHNTVKRALTLLIFVVAFLAGVVVLIVTFVANSNTWATYSTNQHLYSKGNIISAGTVYDADNNILAKTENSVRVYNEDATVRAATLHAVGDTEGCISTGVHSIFQGELTGYSLVNGVYYLKQNSVGNDITLTLKSDVCATAYSALNGKKGTVGVYNYKDGNIVCMASSPSYDPENKPSEDVINSDEYEGVYINRFLSGLYTPGSTFKIITSAAAIENLSDIYSKTFTCTGELDVKGSDRGVICNNVHGTLGFESAFNHSCNFAFAQIAIDIGKTNMQKTVRQLGLTSSYEVDRVEISKGVFDLSDSVDIDIGWAGIGQYTTQINPCMMLSVLGAIANDGVAIKPYFVKSIINYAGVTTYSNSADTVDEINMSSELAGNLKDLMRSNVANYYGDYNFPGLTICGKTGTAEVSNKKSTALFAGFSADEDFPYAVIVIVEDSGTSGYSTAIPIANKVLQSLR